jgi:hypothetical protein
MRIFVVAPTHHDLPDATIEISAIDRRHHATILRGHVRDQDIAEKLNGQSFDIIWWISHGDENGILLSDGVLNIAGARQYLRASGAKLGVLNTCESESVARSIAIGGNADIICTVGAINNRDAIRFGSLLAVELAKTEDFFAAYRTVDPDDGTYKYIRARIAPLDQRKRLMPEVEQELRSQIYGLTSSVNKLEGTVNLNNELTKQSIGVVQEQLTILRAQIGGRPPIWVAYLTVTLLSLIAAAITLASMVWIFQR